MLLQTLIVASIVFGCIVYAGWALLPAAFKQRCAGKLLTWRPSGPGTAFLQKHALRTAGGCGGCGGCASAPKTTPGSPTPVPPALQARPQPVVFHRRMPRREH